MITLKGTPTVYRIFDRDGCCLYVGMSRNIEGRLEFHRQRRWGHEIANVEATPCASTAAALALEASEIRELRPRWNIAGRGPRRDWTACDFAEVLISACEDPVLAITECQEDVIARLRHQFRLRFPAIAAAVIPTVVTQSDVAA